MMKPKWMMVAAVFVGVVFLFALGAESVWSAGGQGPGYGQGQGQGRGQGQGLGPGQGQGQGQNPACAKPECRGCCSRHGGVVCVNGVTQCGDGTPLSDTCRNKGCNACK